MIIKSKRMGLVFAAVLILSGCATVPLVDRDTAKRAFDKAKSLYLLGDYKAAEVYFQTYRNGQTLTARIAEGFYWEGMCLLAQREFEQARGKFKEALEKKPSGWVIGYALCGLGESLMGLGEFASAQEAYLKALDVSKDDIRLDHVLLRVATCAQRRGNWEEADTYISRLLSELPQSTLAEQAREKLQYGKKRFFTVQIGAFKKAESARMRAGELRKQGLKPDAFVGEIKRGGEMLYCVWMVKFESWLEANLAMQRIRGQGRVEQAIVKP